MSGGGGAGRPDSSSEESLDCSRLTFDTSISSPQEDALTQLAIDEVLVVAYETLDGVSVISVRRSDGTLAGTLAGGRIAELLRCLQQGFTYQARVIEIEDALVRVTVEPAS